MCRRSFLKSIAALVALPFAALKAKGAVAEPPALSNEEVEHIVFSGLKQLDLSKYRPENNRNYTASYEPKPYPVIGYSADGAVVARQSEETGEIVFCDANRFANAADDLWGNPADSDDFGINYWLKK